MTTDLLILVCVICGCISSIGLTAYYVHYELRNVDRYSNKRRRQAEEFWTKRRREDEAWWESRQAATRDLQKRMDGIWDALRKELRWEPPDVQERSTDEESN